MRPRHHNAYAQLVVGVAREHAIRCPSNRLVAQISGSGDDCYRRFLPVPARSGGGRLTERIPAVQPRRRERVKVPHLGHSGVPALLSQRVVMDCRDMDNHRSR